MIGYDCRQSNLASGLTVVYTRSTVVNTSWHSEQPRPKGHSYVGIETGDPEIARGLKIKHYGVPMEFGVRQGQAWPGAARPGAAGQSKGRFGGD